MQSLSSVSTLQYSTDSQVGSLHLSHPESSAPQNNQVAVKLEQTFQDIQKICQSIIEKDFSSHQQDERIKKRSWQFIQQRLWQEQTKLLKNLLELEVKDRVPIEILQDFVSNTLKQITTPNMGILYSLIDQLGNYFIERIKILNSLHFQIFDLEAQVTDARDQSLKINRKIAQEEAENLLKEVDHYLVMAKQSPLNQDTQKRIYFLSRLERWILNPPYKDILNGTNILTAEGKINGYSDIDIKQLHFGCAVSIAKEWLVERARPESSKKATRDFFKNPGLLDPKLLNNLLKRYASLREEALLDYDLNGIVLNNVINQVTSAIYLYNVIATDGRFFQHLRNQAVESDCAIKNFVCDELKKFGLTGGRAELNSPKDKINLINELREKAFASFKDPSSLIHKKFIRLVDTLAAHQSLILHFAKHAGFDDTLLTEAKTIETASLRQDYIQNKHYVIDPSSLETQHPFLNMDGRENQLYIKIYNYPITPLSERVLPSFYNNMLKHYEKLGALYKKIPKSASPIPTSEASEVPETPIKTTPSKDEIYRKLKTDALEKLLHLLDEIDYYLFKIEKNPSKNNPEIAIQFLTQLENWIFHPPHISRLNGVGFFTSDGHINGYRDIQVEECHFGYALGIDKIKAAYKNNKSRGLLDLGILNQIIPSYLLLRHASLGDYDQEGKRLLKVMKHFAKTCRLYENLSCSRSFCGLLLNHLLYKERKVNKFAMEQLITADFLKKESLIKSAQNDTTSKLNNLREKAYQPLTDPSSPHKTMLEEGIRDLDLYHRLVVYFFEHLGFDPKLVKDLKSRNLSFQKIDYIQNKKFMLKDGTPQTLFPFIDFELYQKLVEKNEPKKECLTPIYILAYQSLQNKETDSRSFDKKLLYECNQPLSRRTVLPSSYKDAQKNSAALKRLYKIVCPKGHLEKDNSAFIPSHSLNKLMEYEDEFNTVHFNESYLSIDQLTTLDKINIIESLIPNQNVSQTSLSSQKTPKSPLKVIREMPWDYDKDQLNSIMRELKIIHAGESLQYIQSLKLQVAKRVKPTIIIRELEEEKKLTAEKIHTLQESNSLLSKEIQEMEAMVQLYEDQLNEMKNLTASH